MSTAKKDVLYTTVLLTGEPLTCHFKYLVAIPVIARPILLNIYSLYPLYTWSYTYQINFEEIGSVFSKIFVPKVWLIFFIVLQKFWANQKQPSFGSISFNSVHQYDTFCAVYVYAQEGKISEAYI